jgi:hypothetical protein
VYISQLVKTRDPYPGLLQFAIIVSFPFQPAFLLVSLSLCLSLSSLSSHHLLGGGAVMPFLLQEDLGSVSLVSENISHMLQATLKCPSQTNG